MCAAEWRSPRDIVIRGLVQQDVVHLPSLADGLHRTSSRTNRPPAAISTTTAAARRHTGGSFTAPAAATPTSTICAKEAPARYAAGNAAKFNPWTNPRIGTAIQRAPLSGNNRTSTARYADVRAMADSRNAGENASGIRGAAGSASHSPATNSAMNNAASRALRAATASAPRNNIAAIEFTSRPIPPATPRAINSAREGGWNRASALVKV